MNLQKLANEFEQKHKNSFNNKFEWKRLKENMIKGDLGKWSYITPTIKDAYFFTLLSNFLLDKIKETQ